MSTKSRTRAVEPAAPLACPTCARTLLIGPDFVMDVVATGRVQTGGRAEMRCQICGHVWWSKHPEALRQARTAMTVARQSTSVERRAR